MHCSTVLGRMHSPLTSAAVQNRLPAGLCHCKYTYEDLLFIQLCSDPAPVHCNIVLGKKQSPLASVAVQNRLPAGLCHCKYTFEDLPFYHSSAPHSFSSLTTADMSQQGAGPIVRIASKMTITDQHHKTWCQETAWTKN